ncbi:MAG: ABC transporter ATP-binding protein [Defluviicoccus sp.]|nr:ABC transporter ATP-binding protein [Defluviicoccus sp.]MDG4591151.1 ABC transporter ATP-binding protein [Defluviicoccus sp.]MDS4010939.1 ABC transporter ATP-binding protein [Defluviicoccus sp.]MDS4072767.1 ABC transporter ATP-binding protein [Defluviicoccus sp.]
MTEPILEVSGLTKFFGAVAASDVLTFAVERGSIHGLIGPNGAGKSTTIAQLSGELRPDAGRIRFAGTDISAWPVHRRAHAGLQRSYQITSLFPDFTAAENVALAVQARQGHSFRFLAPAREIPSLREPALAVLGRLGLAAKADVPASRLGHGEQRQLELAMVLATRPKMLLLDEPTAGMSRTESRRMMGILRPLKGKVTILLVEHDMDVVFALADAITVLVKGKAIITGPPADVRANENVRRAYLGNY